MEKKLISEFYRLINLYRHTKSSVIKKEIYTTLTGIYYVCQEYGIKLPDISNYILGKGIISDEYFEMDNTSLEFINKLFDIIDQKLILPNYEAYNKMNIKVNKDKYDKIIIEYLKNNKKELYNLYIQMIRENRTFEIKTGFDTSDTNFLTIPYSHERASIIIIDSYPTLSCYYGIIHELAHTHYEEKYKYYGKQAKYDLANDLVEVYPIYSELLLGEYLKQIKITDKNYIFEFTKNQLSVFSKVKLDNYDIHFMGNVLALSFFDMYMEDKEKTEYNFEQFLRNYEGNDFKTNINSFGLSEEKILSLKVLERE